MWRLNWLKYMMLLFCSWPKCCSKKLKMVYLKKIDLNGRKIHNFMFQALQWILQIKKLILLKTLIKCGAHLSAPRTLLYLFITVRFEGLSGWYWKLGLTRTAIFWLNKILGKPIFMKKIKGYYKCFYWKFTKVFFGKMSEGMYLIQHII